MKVVNVSLILGMVVLFTVRSIGYTQDVLPSKVTESEIAIPLASFWKYSILDDQTRLNDTITSVPSNYYANLNRCLEENGEFDRRRAEERGLYVLRRSVNEDIEIEGRYSLSSFSTLIRRKSYVPYKIVQISSADDQAIVKIEYGPSDFKGYVVHILMTRTSDGWKLFSITPKRSLDDDNPYFAKAGCDTDPSQ